MPLLYTCDGDICGISFVCIEGNLIYAIHHIYLAGAEATSTTIRWAMLYMAKYPEIQAKIHKEIDDVVGEPSFSLQTLHIIKSKENCKTTSYRGGGIIKHKYTVRRRKGQTTSWSQLACGFQGSYYYGLKTVFK